MRFTSRRSPQFVTVVSLSLVLVFIFSLVAASQASSLHGLAALAPQAAFTQGNLVVVRVGAGATLTENAAAPVFLDEFTPNGALVQTIPVTPSLVGHRRFTLNGTIIAEGALNLSTNGQYLTLAGYDAAVGHPNVSTGTNSNVVNRVVARVDANGLVDTTTVLTNAYTFHSIRSAVTDDGTRFWTGGEGGTDANNNKTGGTHYVPYGNIGSTVRISNDRNDTRVVSIYNNQLYTSSPSFESGTFANIYQIGTGLPTTPGQPTTRLPGLNSSNSPHAFVMLDRSATIPGVDTLYVANQFSADNLIKYSYNGTTWTQRGAVSGSFVGITGVVSGTSAVLYATLGTEAGNSIVKVTDTAAFDASMIATPTTIATAAANTVFRGVAFAPVNPVVATEVPTMTTPTLPTTTIGIPTTTVTPTVTVTPITPTVTVTPITPTVTVTPITPTVTVTPTATVTTPTATVTTPTATVTTPTATVTTPTATVATPTATVTTPTATVTTPTATTGITPRKTYLPLIMKN